MASFISDGSRSLRWGSLSSLQVSSASIFALIFDVDRVGRDSVDHDSRLAAATMTPCSSTSEPARVANVTWNGSCGCDVPWYSRVFMRLNGRGRNEPWKTAGPDIAVQGHRPWQDTRSWFSDGGLCSGAVNMYISPLLG